MKKKVFLSITAIAVALVTSLFVPTQAYATSVTTTTEIVGVARTEAEASDPQVLGARRGSANSEDVTAIKIKDKEVVKALSTAESVSKIINNVIEKINTAIVNAAVTGTTTTTNTTGSTASTTLQEVKAEELTVVDTMDITPKAGTIVSEEKPLYVTFSFPGVTAKSEVFVLHYHKAVWELVPVTVSEGQIVAKFTSLSPVAIVVKTNTLKGAAVKGASRKKSPRTGDDNYLILIACGAALAFAGSTAAKKYFS